MILEHTVNTPFQPSFRTAKVAGMFDIDAEKGHLSQSWEIDLPIEELDWSIGLIVGSSGSGKTTVARELFKDSYIESCEWNDKPIVDNFPEDMSVDEVLSALGFVGLNSPPSWIKPYHVLSNGEKFRADMAKIIAETKSDNPIVVDEFTSLLDRQVAKVASHAVAKSVRKNNKKFVAISCHSDIAEWLEPDWIYQMDTGEFCRGDLRRPTIELKVERRAQKIWGLFAKHHYLSHKIPNNSHCFVASHEGKPVAFIAIARMPSQSKANYNLWRIARIVTLPDYQGLGIGLRFTDMIAQKYTEEGGRVRIISSHPTIYRHQHKSKNWKMVRSPGRVPPPSKKSTIGGHGDSQFKLTASFEYVAEQE